MFWFQRAYGEDINSQNSKFIIDYLKLQVPAKKKVIILSISFLGHTSCLYQKNSAIFQIQQLSYNVLQKAVKVNILPVC